MFDTNSIAVAIHVLFAGLWIGADLGTFLSYRRVIDPTLEVGTRRAMARYFALIDMGPRTALIVMLGLGLYLAYDRGYGFTSGAWQVAAWIMIIASFLWLALVWYLHWAGEPERSATHARPLSVLRKVDLGWRGVVAVFLIAAGIGTLTSQDPALLDVLGWKMLMLAGIVIIGIVMRFVLPGVLGIIGAIFTEGSTPEREAELRRRSVPVQGLVFGIWVLVLATIWTSVSNL